MPRDMFHAASDMCLPSISLSICLSTSLLATSHENHWLDLHESFARDVSLGKEITIKFWKSYECGSASGDFWTDFYQNSKYYADESRSSWQIRLNFFEGWCLGGDKPLDFRVDPDHNPESVNYLTELLPFQCRSASSLNFAWSAV